MSSKEVAHRRTMKHLEHSIYTNVEPHVVNAWLLKNVGPQWDALDNREGVWTVFCQNTVFWTGSRQPDSKYVYHFTEQQHAIWFALRWS